MKNNFNNLGISPPILKALERMGFETPTEVQNKAIPHILNKEDLIVISKTGSGKTAVFGVPILQMTVPAAAGPQALILTPTRELAVQIDSDLKLISAHLEHKTMAVYGQHNMNTEIQALNKGVPLLPEHPAGYMITFVAGIWKPKIYAFSYLMRLIECWTWALSIRWCKLLKPSPRIG